MPKIKKLGLTINAFDASELLHDLILEIRDQVDWVAAVWQKKSYWKNPMDRRDMEELRRLQSLGLIDELIEFKPNFVDYSRNQECEKRNMGIEIMKQRGCTHVLNIDADEFYDKDQFRYAKNKIDEEGWTNTYWSYVKLVRSI